MWVINWVGPDQKQGETLLPEVLHHTRPSNPTVSPRHRHNRAYITAVRKQDRHSKKDTELKKKKMKWKCHHHHDDDDDEGKSLDFVLIVKAGEVYCTVSILNTTHSCIVEIWLGLTQFNHYNTKYTHTLFGTPCSFWIRSTVTCGMKCADCSHQVSFRGRKKWDWSHHWTERTHPPEHCDVHW